jgi:hypothetical protein
VVHTLAAAHSALTRPPRPRNECRQKQTASCAYEGNTWNLSPRPPPPGHYAGFGDCLMAFTSKQDIVNYVKTGPFVPADKPKAVRNFWKMQASRACDPSGVCAGDCGCQSVSCCYQIRCRQNCEQHMDLIDGQFIRKCHWGSDSKCHSGAPTR